jgi:hypothetical protein
LSIRVKIHIKTYWIWPLLKKRITSFWMYRAQFYLKNKESSLTHSNIYTEMCKIRISKFHIQTCKSFSFFLKKKRRYEMPQKHTQHSSAAHPMYPELYKCNSWESTFVEFCVDRINLFDENNFIDSLGLGRENQPHFIHHMYHLYKFSIYAINKIPKKN